MTIAELLETLIRELKYAGPDAKVYFAASNEETYQVKGIITRNDNDIELLPYKID